MNPNIETRTESLSFVGFYTPAPWFAYGIYINATVDISHSIFPFYIPLLYPINPIVIPLYGAYGTQIPKRTKNRQPPGSCAEPQISAPAPLRLAPYPRSLARGPSFGPIPRDRKKTCKKRQQNVSFT